VNFCLPLRAVATVGCIDVFIIVLRGVPWLIAALAVPN
jgi:hypothetical protein